MGICFFRRGRVPSFAGPRKGPGSGSGCLHHRKRADRNDTFSRLAPSGSWVVTGVEGSKRHTRTYARTHAHTHTHLPRAADRQASTWLLGLPAWGSMESTPPPPSDATGSTTSRHTRPCRKDDEGSARGGGRVPSSQQAKRTSGQAKRLMWAVLRKCSNLGLDETRR